MRARPPVAADHDSTPAGGEVVLAPDGIPKEESMIAHLVATMLAFTASTPAPGTPSASDAQVRVDSARREVVVTVGPIRIPVGGRLRALGGHLHDYAVEIRLEDVKTGNVLARLRTRRHADGRLISVRSTRFVFKRGGLGLAANRPYRVVGVYDNPTSATIPAGAMAFLAGPIIPDDVARWPAVDAGDPVFQQDRRDLLGEGAHAEHGGHGGHGAQR